MKTTMAILFLIGLAAYALGQNNNVGTRCWRKLFSNRLKCRSCPTGCVRYVCSGTLTPYTCNTAVTGAASACLDSAGTAATGTACTRANSNDCTNSYTRFWGGSRVCTDDTCPASTTNNPICDTTN